MAFIIYGLHIFFYKEHLYKNSKLKNVEKIRNCYGTSQAEINLK